MPLIAANEPLFVKKKQKKPGKNKMSDRAVL